MITRRRNRSAAASIGEPCQNGRGTGAGAAVWSAPRIETLGFAPAGAIPASQVIIVSRPGQEPERICRRLPGRENPCCGANFGNAGQIDLFTFVDPIAGCTLVVVRTITLDCNQLAKNPDVGQFGLVISQTSGTCNCSVVSVERHVQRAGRPTASAQQRSICLPSGGSGPSLECDDPRLVSSRAWRSRSPARTRSGHSDAQRVPQRGEVLTKDAGDRGGGRELHEPFDVIASDATSGVADEGNRVRDRRSRATPPAAARCTPGPRARRYPRARDHRRRCADAGVQAGRATRRPAPRSPGGGRLPRPVARQTDGVSTTRTPALRSRGSSRRGSGASRWSMATIEPSGWTTSDTSSARWPAGGSTARVPSARTIAAQEATIARGRDQQATLHQRVCFARTGPWCSPSTTERFAGAAASRPGRTGRPADGRGPPGSSARRGDDARRRRSASPPHRGGSWRRVSRSGGPRGSGRRTPDQPAERARDRT